MGRRGEASVAYEAGLKIDPENTGVCVCMRVCMRTLCAYTAYVHPCALSVRACLNVRACALFVHAQPLACVRAPSSVRIRACMCAHSHPPRVHACLNAFVCALFVVVHTYMHAHSLCMHAAYVRACPPPACACLLKCVCMRARSLCAYMHARSLCMHAVYVRACPPPRVCMRVLCLCEYVHACALSVHA